MLIEFFRKSTNFVLLLLPAFLVVLVQLLLPLPRNSGQLVVLVHQIFVLLLLIVAFFRLVVVLLPQIKHVHRLLLALATESIVRGLQFLEFFRLLFELKREGQLYCRGACG